MAEVGDERAPEAPEEAVWIVEGDDDERVSIDEFADLDDDADLR